MLADNWYVGAYWGNREESAHDCAGRLINLLTCLPHVDHAFDHWFKPGTSTRDSNRREVKPRLIDLESLVRRGAHRSNYDRSVIRELGFTIQLWSNPVAPPGIDMLVHCGGYGSTPTVSIPNSCVIHLPPDGAGNHRLLKTSLLVSILDCIRAAFQPVWAVVTSSKLRSIVPPRDPQSPLIGWITYLPIESNGLPALPVPSRAVPADGEGSFIIVTDEHFSTDNPAHMHAMAQVVDTLYRADVIRPVQYW